MARKFMQNGRDTTGTWMTLLQIQYAVAVSEFKSINAAAKSIYISQSNMSTAIKDLEDELGVTLFERTNRGITLTDDGKEFMSYARNILLQYHLMESRFTVANCSKYHFSVVMHHSTYTAKLFAELVKEFGMEDYDFSIFETTTENVIKEVKEGKSELGILYISSFSEMVYEKKFTEAGLKFRLLEECPVYAYINKKHPLAEKEVVTMEELENYPCLFFEQGDNSLYFYEEIVSAYQHKNVIKTSDRATTIDLLNTLDAYSIGIGMTSNSLMQNSIKAVKIKSDEKIKAGYVSRNNENLSILGERYITKIKNYLHSDAVVK